MPLVTFDQDDQLGEIVIDNPPLNLFSGDMLSDLGSAVEQAAHSKIRAVLVRAAGSDFSAGADASVFAGLDRAGAIELEETVLSLIAAIESLPVPALALIQGQCYAGALEVCLACDLIWAAEGSQIGQIEAVAGGIPYGGGTQRIASRIGAARAAEMVFTGAVLPPETLLSWGLVNKVVTADGLASEGRAFARTLANGPTLCARRHQTGASRVALRRSGRRRPGDSGRGTGHHDEPGPAGRPREPRARRHRPRHLPRQVTLAQRSGYVTRQHANPYDSRARRLEPWPAATGSAVSWSIIRITGPVRSTALPSGSARPALPARQGPWRGAQARATGRPGGPARRTRAHDNA